MGRHQSAVNDQIGIATNGGRKMRIVFQGQTKVPEIHRAIIGLGHRAQCRHIDQLSFGGIRRRAQEFVQMARL